jgi:hypothetical protein
MLVVVALSLVLITVAAVMVHQVLLGADRARARAERAAAERAVTDVVTDFTARLAADPWFFTRELYWAERPRTCGQDMVEASGDPTAPAVAWPGTCPQWWSYPPAGTTTGGYDPAARVVRAQVHPPTATDPAVTLVVAAAVGDAEAARTVRFATPAASAATVWSPGRVDLDAWAPAVRASGTVYAGADLVTPTGPAHTDRFPAGPVPGARLAAACTVTGPVDGAAGVWSALEPGDRAFAGCAGEAPEGAADLRDLAPVPLTADAADRAAAVLADLACTGPAPALVEHDGATWSTAVCLHPGALLVTVDGEHVQVPVDAAAYRVSFAGSATAPTVVVDVAAAVTDPDDVAAAAAAYAHGTHPVSDPGVAWIRLGELPAPVTGLVATDRVTYVGACAAALGGDGCAQVAPPVPLTLVAGTPADRVDVVLAGPVGGPVTLVATGSLRVGFYARPAGTDLVTGGHLVATGAALTAPAPDGWSGGQWTHTGALGAVDLPPLGGWDAVDVVAGDVTSRWSWAPTWRQVATRTLTTAQVCQAATCATW